MTRPLRSVGNLAGLTVRPLRPEADAAVLHAWVTSQHAVFWGMQEASPAQVAREYAEIVGSPHSEALLGLHHGEPAFLMETYDPAHHELAGHYPVAAGDLGMHFLVAPTERPVRGFTRAVLRTVLEVCFADPAVQRVVVEPDVRNTRVHALNAAVGFTVSGPVALSDKTALLSFCTRTRFSLEALR